MLEQKFNSFKINLTYGRHGGAVISAVTARRSWIQFPDSGD